MRLVRYDWDCAVSYIFLPGYVSAPGDDARVDTQEDPSMLSRVETLALSPALYLFLVMHMSTWSMP